MLRFLLALTLSTALFAEEKISTHSIQIGEETLTYTSTVSSGPVSYIAYVKEGANRPITFAFNGGPGSSSVWLHLGTFGPRRVMSVEEGQKLSPPYKLVDNLETILDLTDLVFIDPPGTGLSPPKEKDAEKNPYSIDGDIEAVGTFIRDYLTQNRRWNSAKYIAGESYGALRATGLADYLQNEHGIYLNGLILISSAIDFQTFIFHEDNPAPYFLFLPSFATTAWYHGLYRPEATVEEVAQEARDFVYQTYAPSLLCRKCYDLEPIYQKLSEMTALPIDLVRRNRGRIEDFTFFTELLASERKSVGRFDSRVSGYMANPFQDPSDSVISGIFSGAFHEYLQTELETLHSYNLFSAKVNMEWNFQAWGYPNLMNCLRRSLSNNPEMKIFAACGYYDLATPFATMEYCLDHLDVPNISIQIEYYEGGHMYYLNPKARVKFKQDLIRFYQKD